MPESRGGTSGGEGWLSSVCTETGHTSSWRMEGAEEEEEEEEEMSSGISPVNPEVDLRGQKQQQQQSDKVSHTVGPMPVH